MILDQVTQPLSYPSLGQVLPLVKQLLTRQHLGALAVASSFGIYLTQPSLYSPFLPLGIVLMWFGVGLIGVRRPAIPLLICFGMIVGSAWIAVVLSPIVGRPVIPSIWLALLTSVLVPLAWVAKPRLVLAWLTPVWLLQAGLSIAEWITVGGRVRGLSENQNAGAAFLLLGCVYLINGNSKAKWLMLPMVAAMPFAGSRWVVMVAGVLFLSLFTSRYISWRYIAVGIGVTLMVVFALNQEGILELFLSRSSLNSLQEGTTSHVVGFDVEDSLSLSFIPLGFFNSGIHTLPLRMAHETGMLSAVAWIFATGWVLWTKRFNIEWWMLLTVALLAAMYYHIWVGPLGGFWWLLLAGGRSPARV